MNIEWKRKDNAKGYGVGVLKIGNASIPIIVSDFQLAEMDVVMIGGIAYPLTPETLNEMMASPDAFQGLKGGVGKNLSLFGLVDNDMFQNYGTGTTREGTSYAERPAIKLASFIEKVSNIQQTDVDHILEYVENHPEVANQFVTNGTYDVIEKIASLDTITEESFAKNILRGVEIDRHMIYEDSRGNTFMKQANSKVDYT